MVLCSQFTVATDSIIVSSAYVPPNPTISCRHQENKRLHLSSHLASRSSPLDCMYTSQQSPTYCAVPRAFSRPSLTSRPSHLVRHHGIFCPVAATQNAHPSHRPACSTLIKHSLVAIAGTLSVSWLFSHFCVYWPRPSVIRVRSLLRHRMQGKIRRISLVRRSAHQERSSDLGTAPSRIYSFPISPAFGLGIARSGYVDSRSNLCIGRLAGAALCK